MDSLPTQTVADWTARGYRGLRIMRCLDCPGSTYRTWSELAAEPHEDVVAVARRMRCQGCGQPPAGLAVVTSIGTWRTGRPATRNREWG